MAAAQFWRFSLAGLPFFERTNMTDRQLKITALLVSVVGLVASILALISLYVISNP